MCLTYPKRSYSDLATALAEFRQILSSDQTAQLSSFSSKTPTADDIVQLTDDIMKANAGRKSRILASRAQGLLCSVQQYCTIVDMCAGPNQIAALVWGSIKLVLLVRNQHYYHTSLTYVCLLARFRPTLPNILTSCPSVLLSSATTVPDYLNMRSFFKHHQGCNKQFRTFMLLW